MLNKQSSCFITRQIEAPVRFVPSRAFMAHTATLDAVEECRLAEACVQAEVLHTTAGFEMLFLLNQEAFRQ